ncbi:MAG: acyltransferase family protein [Acidovorax sp.]|nr:acyltransferase family protein [Acidovorax sp.]
MVWLDVARVAAIMAVVLLHVSAILVVETPLGSAAWWIGNFYDSLVRWCVPVFVMISGALLLDACKVEDLWRFYRKRAARILLPLLFWSTFYILWNHRSAWTQMRTADVLQSVARGWPHYHLWFLYMLFCLYLFVPFLRVVVWHTPRRDLWWLVAAMFVMSGMNEWYRVTSGNSGGPFINWFLQYLPYFVCGYLLRTESRTVPAQWLVAVFGLSVAVTAAGCFWWGRAYGLEKGLYFYSYLSVPVIFMSLSAMLMLKRCSWGGTWAKVVRQLSQLTLGAYLVHPVLLESLQSSELRLGSQTSLWALPLVALLVFVGSLGVAWVFLRTPLLNRTI